MTSPALKRDDILDDGDRTKSGLKCLQVLADDADLVSMSPKDRSFYLEQRSRAKRVGWSPSDPQLLWLRDLVERYAT